MTLLFLLRVWLKFAPWLAGNGFHLQPYFYFLFIAIYRGSTRLWPLFHEMQTQKKVANQAGPNKQGFARRAHAINRGKHPFIEYTRNAEVNHEDDLMALIQHQAASLAGIKKPTARKSSTQVRKNDLIGQPSRPDPNR